MTSLKSHAFYASALEICQTLKSANFEALIAGGAVRDALLGISPHDIDIATSATPEQVAPLFKKTVMVGAQFGVVRVEQRGHFFEVATFRKDGPSQDGRRPTSVVFSSAEEDAKRRDFTVNALFWEPFREVILDYVGGQKALQAKIIQTVGDPLLRFEEDHLRLLRALRFSSRFDFEIENETWQAIKSRGHLIAEISRERIRDELLKMFSHSSSRVALKLLLSSRLLNFIFAQLEPFDLVLFEDEKRSRLGAECSAVEGLLRFLFPLIWNRPENLELARQVFKSLKLSRNEEVQLEKGCRWLSEENKFWEKPLRSKLWELAQPETLNLYLKILHPDLNQTNVIEQLRVEYMNEQWPPAALLKGHDMLELLNEFSQSTPGSGKANLLIGEALQEAYVEQLEQKWKTKEQALVWVRNWFKGKLNE